MRDAKSKAPSAPPSPIEDEDDGAPLSTREIPVVVPGAAPGTLQIESTDRPKICLIDYDTEKVEELEIVRLDEAAPFLSREVGVTWIDIQGIGCREVFEELGRIFEIHPLALEDVVNVPQRPKSDVYENHQLFVTRMVSMQDDAFFGEQLSILFGRGYVVTVQEEPDIDCLEPLRQRIRAGRGIIRRAGSDYLAYAIFDAVVDGFYPVLEHYGELLDELELRVLSPNGVASAEIFDLKRELLSLRRAIWPQRDLLSSLLRDESPHIKAETRVYLRDTYDHAVQIIDMVETFREIASSLMDLLMTQSSNRMNEVMKVLTIVSTIFLPMTFVAGVYGMNFDTNVSRWNMPELEWIYGYPFSIGLMIASAGSLLLYYRYRGWLTSGKPKRGRKRARHGASRKSATPPPP